jgi:hypothetical protein
MGHMANCRKNKEQKAQAGDATVNELERHLANFGIQPGSSSVACDAVRFSSEPDLPQASQPLQSQFPQRATSSPSHVDPWKAHPQELKPDPWKVHKPAAEQAQSGAAGPSPYYTAHQLDSATGLASVLQQAASSSSGLPVNSATDWEGAPLPAGWLMEVDPASGHPYYCNTKSGQTTWDKPTTPA